MYTTVECRCSRGESDYVQRFDRSGERYKPQGNAIIPKISASSGASQAALWIRKLPAMKFLPESHMHFFIGTLWLYDKPLLVELVRTLPRISQPGYSLHHVFVNHRLGTFHGLNSSLEKVTYKLFMLIFRITYASLPFTHAALGLLLSDSVQRNTR